MGVELPTPMWWFGNSEQLLLTCSFFVEFAAFFVRKKEQARGESIGERSKGRGEMDVGERGEWDELGREENGKE